MTLKNNISDMTIEEAQKILDNIYSDPQTRPTYNNQPVDNNIDLSIIVPIYNYAKLIRKNIDSILEQKTKYNFEVILVDDGSTDGARDIVLSYQDRKNIKVILQENGGIASARNTGIDNATGKYLMFVDCDDVVHDDIVEILLSTAYQEDCDIVMCAHNLSKEKEGKIYSNIPNIYPQNNLLNYKNNDEIMNYAGLPWGKVYKREMWNNVRFFPKYWYEDTIIQFLIFMQCKKFSYVPKVCYEYRWYEKNFSHIQGNHKNIKSIDQLYILKAILEQYDRIKLPKDKRFYTVLIKHLSAYYYNTIKGLDEKTIEALFIVANNIAMNNYIENTNMPYVLKIAEKAILTKNIDLWKLSSTYQ